MSLITRLSQTFQAAKKAWYEPVNPIEEVKPLEKVVPPGASPYYIDTISKVNGGEEVNHTTSFTINVNNLANPVANPYYTDTISKANDGGEEPISIVASNTKHKNFEARLDELTATIDKELAKETQDFEKLHALIYKVIMMMMRLGAKSESEQIREFTIKIKDKAQDIKATYNTWQGLTITVISSAVSVAGGIAGLSPFLPASVISAQSAQALLQASQSIGTAGTGIGGIGSIFNNRSEGLRRVEELNQKLLESNQEELKGFKQNKSEHIKTAKATAEEFERNRHQAHSAAAAA
jgi:hypothetical protein